MKKFLSILLSVIMAFSVFSVMPFSAFALDTYVVAGSPSEIFGTGWDATNTNNIMTINDYAQYEKGYTVTKAYKNVQLKVVKNKSEWIGDEYGNNVKFNLTGPGEFFVVYDTGLGYVVPYGSIVSTETFDYSSVSVAGNGDGNWLNGIAWDPAKNMLTQVEDDVWEITYNGVAASDDCYFKFCIDSSWNTNFGAGDTNAIVSDAEYDAVYYSSTNIQFKVTEDNSTVKLRLDLSNYIPSTKEGAKYTVTIIPPVEKYDLYVGGEQVTSANAKDVFGDGTVSFDADTSTLTLNNATLRTSHDYSVIYSELPNLNVVLNGNNKIAPEVIYSYCGISVPFGKVDLIGGGSLTLNDVGSGISAQEVTLNNVSVTIDNPQTYGIYADNGINIINSSLNINRNNSYTDHGAVAINEGIITITDSDVDITNYRPAIHLGGESDDKVKLVINSGNVTLKSNVYAINSWNTDSSIEINGGTLDVTSAEGGTNITNIAVAKELDYTTGTALAESGHIVIEKPSHSHSYTAVVTKPTCSNKGYTTHTCSCGDSYVDSITPIDPNNHQWDGGKVTKTATVEETGIRTYTCQYNPKHTKTEVIPKLKKAPVPSNNDANSAKVNTSIPKPAGITTICNTKKKQMTITFNKVAGAENYRIAYRKQGAKNWTYKWTGGKATYALTNLKEKGLYEFKFAAYKKVDGKWQRGDWSAVSYRYMKKLTQNALKTKNKSMTVSWSKDTNANYYVIFYSTDKNFKTQKKVTVKDVKKTSYTIKKLTKGKTYYVRVRAYKTVNKKNYAGELSAMKSIKVK